MGPGNVKCDDIYLAMKIPVIPPPAFCCYCDMKGSFSFHCQMLQMMTLWCLLAQNPWPQLKKNGKFSLTCLWISCPEASAEVQRRLEVSRMISSDQLHSRIQCWYHQNTCIAEYNVNEREFGQGGEGCEENWGSKCSCHESSYVPGTLYFLDSGEHAGSIKW